MKLSTGLIWVTSISVVGSPSTLENFELISSINITSFVSDSVKSVNLVFFNCMNLDLEVSTSPASSLVFVCKPTNVSLPWSKLNNVSTLNCSITSRVITVWSLVAILTWVVDVIPVSAKFLVPTVWTKLLTGLSSLFHSIGLWI